MAVIKQSRRTSPRHASPRTGSSATLRHFVNDCAPIVSCRTQIHGPQSQGSIQRLLRVTLPPCRRAGPRPSTNLALICWSLSPTSPAASQPLPSRRASTRSARVGSQAETQDRQDRDACRDRWNGQCLHVIDGVMSLQAQAAGIETMARVVKPRRQLSHVLACKAHNDGGGGGGRVGGAADLIHNTHSRVTGRATQLTKLCFLFLHLHDVIRCYAVLFDVIATCSSVCSCCADSNPRKTLAHLLFRLGVVLGKALLCGCKRDRQPVRRRPSILLCDAQRAFDASACCDVQYEAAALHVWHCQARRAFLRSAEQPHRCTAGSGSCQAGPRTTSCTQDTKPSAMLSACRLPEVSTRCTHVLHHPF